MLKLLSWLTAKTTPLQRIKYFLLLSFQQKCKIWIIFAKMGRKLFLLFIVNGTKEKTVCMDKHINLVIQHQISMLSQCAQNMPKSPNNHESCGKFCCVCVCACVRSSIDCANVIIWPAHLRALAGWWLLNQAPGERLVVSEEEVFDLHVSVCTSHHLLFFLFQNSSLHFL